MEKKGLADVSLLAFLSPLNEKKERVVVDVYIVLLEREKRLLTSLFRVSLGMMCARTHKKVHSKVRIKMF